MNTGTVSGTLTAPTIVTIPSWVRTIQICNSGTSVDTIVYAQGKTTLASTDSTLEPGQSAPIDSPPGVGTVAFASLNGSASSATIQFVRARV